MFLQWTNVTTENIWLDSIFNNETYYPIHFEEKLLLHYILFEFNLIAGLKLIFIVNMINIQYAYSICACKLCEQEITQIAF